MECCRTTDGRGLGQVAPHVSGGPASGLGWGGAGPGRVAGGGKGRTLGLGVLTLLHVGAGRMVRVGMGQMRPRSVMEIRSGIK